MVKKKVTGYLGIFITPPIVHTVLFSLIFLIN